MKILISNGITLDEAFRGHECGENVTEPDGIVLRSADVPERLQDSVVAISCTGEATSDGTAIAEAGIVLLHTPKANVTALKEHILCELLLSARQAAKELSGKKLGVMGLNAVGVQITHAALALGMEVLSWDPSPFARDRLDRRAIFTTDPVRLMRECDFLVLLCGAERAQELWTANLRNCREGIVVLNYAQELPCIREMQEAVREGKISRYMTAFSSENAEWVAFSPLLPSSEGEADRARTAAYRLADYLENGNIAGGVNFPNLSIQRAERARLCVLFKEEDDLVQKVLAVLAAQGLGILQTGSRMKGSFGYLMIDLSGSPSEACVQLVRGIAGVLRVRVIENT